MEATHGSRRRGVAKAFTREESTAWARWEFLKPSGRVELIEGEIVQMSPIGRRVG